MNPRTIAAKNIYQVIYQGKSLTDVLLNKPTHQSINPSIDKKGKQTDKHLNKKIEKPLINKQAIEELSEQETAWIKNICFGSLRWHHQITALLDLLISKPMKRKDKDVECLIRIGLYQIMYQETPDHAAVNETVAASQALKKKWARGLINGVLRRFLRDQEALREQCDRVDTNLYSYPQWLLHKLQQAWPENWQEIVTASNQRAPMTIRVNVQRQTRNAYLTRLQENQLPAAIHPHVDSALVLDNPVNVSQLPDFFTGACSVQDASAQLAAHLLDCQPEMSVLDACAAPGGKTGHIGEQVAEQASALRITALDNDAVRLVRVKENLERLNQQATLIEADANQIADWYNGEPYDRILLDAPCSATGVIRRHPDIKLLRKQSDIKNLVKQQQQLLETLWKILKSGGKLLYATCSILPEENDQQISHFVTKHNDVIVIPLSGSWGTVQQYGKQIFPGAANMDGFYYSLLEKR